MWTLTGCKLSALTPGSTFIRITADDSAAHISEETTNAAWAGPLAILIGVGATASLGWLILIAASFALTSVSALLDSELALPMGQLFLDVLGKKGMLAVWSLIIVVQVSKDLYQREEISKGQLHSLSQAPLRRWMPRGWSLLLPETERYPGPGIGGEFTGRPRLL